MSQPRLPIPETELILNADGSVYHLNLLPDDIAETIITVGDPDRVRAVTQHFDTIDVSKQKREFLTETGTLGGKRLTVISTGIGTDNIDIVLNELDALANIDFKSRMIKENHTVLQFIRIGTSGCLQADIPVDSFLVSEMAVGMDGLMNFYERDISDKEKGLEHSLPSLDIDVKPYATSASVDLMEQLGDDMLKGITVTCTGFYAPQGRSVRTRAKQKDLLDKFKSLNYNDLKCTNFEMETAGIYGLASVLGHQAISFNALLANRSTKQFSQQPQQTVNDLIELVLERIMDS